MGFCVYVCRFCAQCTGNDLPDHTEMSWKEQPSAPRAGGEPEGPAAKHRAPWYGPVACAPLVPRGALPRPCPVACALPGRRDGDIAPYRHYARKIRTRSTHAGGARHYARGVSIACIRYMTFRSVKSEPDRSPVTFPSLITRDRWQLPRISPRSEEMRRMATPVAASPCIIR